MLNEPMDQSANSKANWPKEIKEQFTIHVSVALASSLVTGAFIYAALANDWGVGLVAATLVPAAFAVRYIREAVRSGRNLSWARAEALLGHADAKKEGSK
jgi:hypothetical protein